jgi:hypothetical protein
MTDTPQETTEDPQATQPPEPTADVTEQLHGHLIDAAKKLVGAIEGIYSDDQIRGDVVTAKNALKDILARVEQDATGGDTTPPPTEPAQ